jgi:hypothetical protein
VGKLGRRLPLKPANGEKPFVCKFLRGFTILSRPTRPICLPIEAQKAA